MAAGRCISPQLLNETMKANRRRWSRDLSEKANAILDGLLDWPSDPLEGLMVGCLYSFLLAERDDLATGRYVNDPHYVVVEVVNREEDEETDDEDDKEDPDWWKE
jgi:hypothetical protein